MRAGVLVLFAALLVMFAGCATKNEAYTEAKQLLAEGKIDTGLASLEEAARKEPEWNPITPAGRESSSCRPRA